MKIKKKKLKKVFENYYKLVIKSNSGHNDFVESLKGSGFTAYDGKVVEIFDAEKLMMKQFEVDTAYIKTCRSVHSAVSEDDPTVYRSM